MQRVRNKNQNPFLGEDKNENGYDAVLKAIQKQDEKETNAAIIIQAWWRMILAIRFVRNLREERKRNIKMNKEKKSKPKLQAKEENLKVQNETPIEQNTEKQTKPVKSQKLIEESSKPQNKIDEKSKQVKAEDQPIQKKGTVTQNVPLKKRDSIEAPLGMDTPVLTNQQDNLEDQREKLKKITSKPTFAKKK